jgi:hypothetical protein
MLHIGRRSSVGRAQAEREVSRGRWAAVALVLGLAFLCLAPAAMASENGGISGTVTSVSPKTGITGIEVCAYAATGPTEECVFTNSKGEYTMSGLPAGKYLVEFFAPPESGLNFVTQYYNGVASFEEATEVTVVAEATTPNIDALLEEGGAISGNVTDALSGLPLNEVFVCAFGVGAGSPPGNCALTGPSGQYTITGLGSGKYKVGFNDGHEYVIQYYNGKSSLAEAEEVTVTAPATVTGIDAALQHVSTLPVNTTLPVLSGTPAVGSTLLCANGLWTGIPAPTFSQQWLRDGLPITGALGSSYVVGEADAGHSVSCQVTATNIKGHRSATSAAIGIPAPPPPPPPPAPQVVVIGSKLSVSGKATKVHLACTRAACAGSVELTISVVVKHRKGKKTVSRRETLVLAKGSYSIAAGASANVTLRLTATGQKQLAHAKHSPVSAEVRVTVAGGSTANKSVHVI